jgi:hypothetical protein
MQMHRWLLRSIGSEPQKRISPSLYFIIVLLAYPIRLFFPTHILLKKLFTNPGCGADYRHEFWF